MGNIIKKLPNKSKFIMSLGIMLRAIFILFIVILSSKIANNFIVSAIAEDGTIEAIESGNIIGVQWHPERMNDIILFNNLIKEFFKL